MKFLKLSDLPETHNCNICGQDKPVAEMLVIQSKKTRTYDLRRRCKVCHNQKQKGHRLDYKRNYLKRWRARHPKLNKSYQQKPECKRKNRRRVYEYFTRNHEAILIKGRMQRRGIECTLSEAQRFLERFGPCYPSRYGLTAAGQRECERIRATMRRRGSALKLRNIDIRMMVYEDGLFIAPELQPKPYQKAAERLRELKRSQRERLAA